jgi:DNA-directed RNA polymerase specialized sigma24 family protein
MARVDDFDAFYHATRRPLLHQTYALTGDVERTATAVEHAYAQAWSQWRRVRGLPDPVAWVRTEAWRAAHSARPRWRRRSGRRRFGGNPDASPHRSHLRTLHALPDAQRRVVVLHHLAELPVDRIAREVGISQTSAASLLIQGEQAWGAGGTSVGTALAGVEEDIVGVRLARAPHLRRSGDRRYRQQAVVGVVTAAALMVGGGLLIVNDGPASIEQASTAGAGAPRSSGARSPGAGLSGNAPEPFLLGEDALLTPVELRGLSPSVDRWTVTSTTDGTTGDPFYAACQPEPFADPDGEQSLLRRFRSDGDGPSAVQVIEESRSEAESAKAFATMEDWYARCGDDGVQLLATLSVDGLGDQARAFQLRDLGPQHSYLTVGIVRTGPITTAVIASTRAPKPVSARRVLDRAGVSVTRTCLRVSGDCSTMPRMTRVPPLPAEEHPGFLSAFDLPKVSGVGEPWVGTDPVRSLDDPAATACERANFRRGQRPRSRVFVLPTAKDVPRRFGLTETVATFDTRADARTFVRQAFASADSCADRELSASRPVSRELPGDHHGRAWRFEFEVSEQRSASYRMGLVRAGRRVAQLTLSPTKGYDVDQREFGALVVRAGQRLTEADG